MSSSSYIESVLPHPIGKSYAAQFQAHGFDMPSTLKFITYKDLIDVVQMKSGEARAVWNSLVNQGIVQATKCPLCGGAAQLQNNSSSSPIKAKDVFVSSATSLKAALPSSSKTADDESEEEDPNAAPSSPTNVSTNIQSNSSTSTNIVPSIFMYQSDFDGNGIVHHLMNKSSVIKSNSSTHPIQCSRCSNGQGKAYDPLFNVSTTCCTSNSIPNEWWMFDFGSTRAVNPVMYTLKHGYTSGYALKHWNLEGSNDKTTWVCLKSHKNDQSLAQSSTKIKTYMIPSQSSSFRYLRIYMTDKNTNNSWTFCLGGVEFYGELYEGTTSSFAPLVPSATTSSVKSSIPTSAPPVLNTVNSSNTTSGSKKSFVYSGVDFDNCGIVHHLMSSVSKSNSSTHPIQCSRCSNGQGTAYDPLFNVSTTCCTSNSIPNEWWMFDFGSTRTVNVVAYTLKHGYSGGYVLKHWNLEGSNDKTNWVCLKSHKNDQSLAQASAKTKTYMIPSQSSSFRYLRIYMTDKNTDNSWTFCLGGVEFYGDLYDTNSYVPPATSMPASSTTTNCPGKHGLTKFHTPVANYGCDVCKKRFPAGTTLHGCRSCNYDVCESCVSFVAPTTSVKSTIPTSAPPTTVVKCTNLHPLVLGGNVGNSRYWTNSFNCDICRSSGSVSNGYSCSSCCYDLCASCYSKKNSTNVNATVVKCTNLHPLVLGGNVGNSIYRTQRFSCNGCRSTGSVSNGYSCSTCSYDLCASCYSKKNNA